MEEGIKSQTVRSLPASHQGTISGPRQERVCAPKSTPVCSGEGTFFAFFLATTQEPQNYQSSLPWGATGPRGEEKGHGEENLPERISKIHPKIFRCQLAPSQNSFELLPQRIPDTRANGRGEHHALIIIIRRCLYLVGPKRPKTWNKR